MSDVSDLVLQYVGLPFAVLMGAIHCFLVAQTQNPGWTFCHNLADNVYLVHSLTAATHRDDGKDEDEPYRAPFIAQTKPRFGKSMDDIPDRWDQWEAWENKPVWSRHAIKMVHKMQKKMSAQFDRICKLVNCREKTTSTTASQVRLTGQRRQVQEQRDVTLLKRCDADIWRYVSCYVQNSNKDGDERSYKCQMDAGCACCEWSLYKDCYFVNVCSMSRVQNDWWSLPNGRPPLNDVEMEAYDHFCVSHGVSRTNLLAQIAHRLHYWTIVVHDACFT